MARPRKAALDIDALMDRPLGELSASEFLQVLRHPKLGFSGAAILADKKKYELWVEEDPILKIPIGEIIERIRGEKKKVEYEIPDIIGPRINPGDVLGRIDYGRLVEDVAEEVARRLGK